MIKFVTRLFFFFLSFSRSLSLDLSCLKYLVEDFEENVDFRKGIISSFFEVGLFEEVCNSRTPNYGINVTLFGCFSFSVLYQLKSFDVRVKSVYQVNQCVILESEIFSLIFFGKNSSELTADLS